MAESTAPATPTPWHLWLVGALSLLWNAMGALDFTLTQAQNEAYLKSLTPEQLEYVHGFPFWAVLSWGIATWGSLIGSMLLLARRKLTVPVNLAVLLAMVPTFTYNYILSDGLKVMKGGVGSVMFTATIVLVGVLLYLYARALRQRGVLR